jgi:hypothetical protein
MVVRLRPVGTCWKDQRMGYHANHIIIFMSMVGVDLFDGEACSRYGWNSHTEPIQHRLTAS